MMRKVFSKNSLTALAICLVASTSVPAHAYYWGYSPYSGRANWLWMARSLSYPLNRLSTPTRPFYLGSGLIWNGSYAANQALNPQRQVYQGSYADPEPFYYPRQRTRPVSDSAGVNDQVVSAQRRSSEPVPAQPAPQFAPAPIVAPPLIWPQQRANSPMAQAFVDLVVGKYEGNISKALFDPPTRSFARAIGLVDGDELFSANLNQDRIDLVKKILLDQREDAAAKISAVRLLLKN